VPGTTDTGNHGDDIVTQISFPFPVRFYNNLTYNTANVSSNGNLQFVTTNTAFTNACLPVAAMGPAIFPHWDDQRTDTTGSCSPSPCGIFTSVSGSAPARIFNIEWRVYYFTGAGTANYEVRLHEDTRNFEVILGTLGQGGTGATIGVQDDTGARFTEVECDTGAPNNTQYNFNFVGCGATETSTPTRTPCPTCTNTPTNSPTATATGTPCGGIPGWTDRAPITAAPGITRADAVYVPSTGLIYVIGGRSADTPGAFNQTIYTYNPNTNAWAIATTVLTDTKTSNLAVVLLNGPGGARIYAVGGSAPTGSPDLLPSNVVRVYDPVGGTLTSADAWPQTSPYVIPGGWSVFNNRLYMFGGYDPFNTPTTMISDIWEFDPMRPAGSMWAHKSAHLSIARGYIATETIGNFIYLAGGSQATGNPLTNETITEKYNPAADTIATVAPMSVASSNFSAYTDGTLLYAPGGVFPTAVDTMQVYNPATDSWTTGASMTTAVRNYASATVGNSFYAIGGYLGATISPANQRYNAPSGCPPTSTPTVGVTNTATRTSSPTPPSVTPTPCNITFSDVNPPDYFYVPVMYLACHGVISGYSDGTFRPYNNTTRGQLTKIVVLAEGWTLDCTSQHFSDVPPSHTFYCYVETAVAHGIISGYADGTFKPGNDVTRGQLTKIVVLAEGWANDCATQHFSDVPPSHPFYCYVETAFAHGIISGYADGTFRPGNSATRGQISKIVYEAVTGP
jgi:hypothetical protein